ncbi:transcription-associated protein [Elsinoe australis]|uniref:Transcription-associated protein n=1 Tax=Elsinoe australis TaxID=40998 RepID=A0A4U7B5L2_9PEZI|nr:transcription-associated protein [Elsinoe australis]
MAERNLDAIEAKFQDSSTDVKTKFGLLADIRDGIDHYCQGSSYTTFLKKFIPIFTSILDGSPVFISTSPEQRMRNTVLEILHRLPTNLSDVTDPYAPQIVDKCMELIKVENEDNAVLCLKIIMDFERHHPKSCGDKVQAFLDLIIEIFDTMEASVRENFDNIQPAGAPGTPAAGQSPRPSSPVVSANAIVADVGSDQQQTLVSLFQANRNLAPKNVKNFIQRIKTMLLLQAKPQQRGHEEAAAREESFTRIAREIGTNPAKRAAFGEFVTAQVKTMSFLAYLMRVYQNMMQDFIPQLPEIVIRLLQDCPREKSATRKELLVAIRHIINFNFRTIFLPKLDELMDERTLIGDGLTVYENSRFLAYTMLADLVHHVRDQLTPTQIRKTIVVYTKNLHDDCHGANFQTMSAKLLFNMAECMAKVEDKQDARHFLIMVLDAVAEKCASMNRDFKNAVKVSAGKDTSSVDATPENYFADRGDPPDWDDVDIFSATPIKTTNTRNHDPVTDNKAIFKNMVHGLKTIFFSLRTTNPNEVRETMDSTNVPSNWHEISYGFSAEEVRVLVKLFHEGAQMFRYFSPDKPIDDALNTTPVEVLANQLMMSGGKEEKDLLEAFAGVFHHIDPSTFYEIFQLEIPHLFDMIFEHAALLHIPQFLLASEATSPPFCGMLLHFLMDRLYEVGTADVQKSSVMLRLFKLSFMAVTLFSAQNEQVLLPHVVKLITRSIELSVTADEPMNYFILLRSLFRSIGGGRFEHLYKEILPLLEMLLEVLNNLLVAARRPQDRDLFVELSLTVPARLSHLLPHLSYLMRPLVVALRAGSELIAQGLRTLELCVDNLTADYLDPIMAPVIDDLMSALWDHLKPAPYNHFHSHTTLRILGKLGGRNRKFLTNPPQLDYKPYADDEASFDIKLVGTTKERAFPTRLGYEVAIAKLHDVPKLPAAKKSDTFHKQQALNLIKTQTKLLIGQDHLPDDFAQLVRLQADDLYAKKFDVPTDLFSISERDKSGAKRDAQQDMLLKLIKGTMFATSVPEIKEDASAFLGGLYRHFTILEFGRALAYEAHKTRPFDPNLGEGAVCIDSRLVADAIAETLSSDNGIVRDEAASAMKAMWQNAATIFGSDDKVESLPLFNHLLGTLVHQCYEEEWFVKSGGVEGINIAVTSLSFSDGWLRDRQGELVTALMFVMKDMPNDLPATVRIKANDLLQVIVRKCNTGIAASEIENNQSSIHKLSNRLIMEVSHMNKHVRNAARDALSLLAEVVGVQLWEVVKPVKELVLGHIFNKPLRALPFAVQIGYLEALTFCLELENDVLEFEERLNRSLLETLALADAEDESLAPKPQEHRNADSIVNLRVACLRLLTAAFKMPAFNAPQHQQHRNRIITVFFKCLYSKHKLVSDAANIGLKTVLQLNPKLPKELLQSGLRPILMNVQDPRKLNVEGLEGLRTLLQLLTNYFKVEIGQRLLDHMIQIADATSLQKISFSMIELHPKIKIVTAIFSVFHLLPSAASQFLPTLVDRILHLEKALRRTHFSPFREPLIKYLNAYPKESWEYFSQNIADSNKGRLWAQVLADEDSATLRKEFHNAENLVDLVTGQSTDAEGEQAAINIIQATAAVTSFRETSQLLSSNEALRTAIAEASKSLSTKLKNQTLTPTLRLAVEQVNDQILTLFSGYLKQNPSDLDFFFGVMRSCADGQLQPTSVLFNYLYEHVISSEDNQYQKKIATRSIELYNKQTEGPYMKSFVFRNVLSPIFAMDVKRNWSDLFEGKKGTPLLDKAMVDTVHNSLWKLHGPNDISEELAQPGIDHSRMELLQFSAFLLKYYHDMLSDCRKDVIMFAWLYIRLEDVINKYAAFCVIAYFIAHYETPSKIATQIYSRLLGAHQAEGRALVMQALEILQPVLKKRIGDQNTRMPMWARIPRKVLGEEPSNVQHLTCIYQFLVRHPDLFFEARESFTSFIVPTLAKVCTLPNASVENKRLALNLFTMIWKWEERSLNERTESGAEGERTFVTGFSLRTMLIKYMVQFIASISERYPVPSGTTTDERRSPATSEVVRKAVDLLYKFLSPGFWDDLDIDSMYPKITEQILLSDPKQEEKVELWTTRVVNTLQIVRIFLNVKPDDWVLARVGQLQKLLTKPLKNEASEVQDALFSDLESTEGHPKLKTIMQRIMESIPLSRPEDELPDADDASEEFMTFIGTTAGDALSANNLHSSINILWSMSQRKQDSIDSHIPALLKALQGKLAKDHIASQMPSQAAAMQGMPAPPNANPQDVDITVLVTIKVIDMISSRISILGDQRRPYLSIVASIVERSQNVTLCTKVLDMVNDWIFNSTEPVPTLKEKTAVLQKMLLFEDRPDSTLYHQFLDLVIRIYEDPKIYRTELAVRMEQAFLIGLRSSDIPMRTRFMSIFDKSLSRTMANRFYKLIAEQQWDVLAQTCWLSQVIHLMFGSIDMSAPARLQPEDYKTFPASRLFGTYAGNDRIGSVMLDDGFEKLASQERRFMQDISEIKVKDVLEPLANLQHTDWQLCHDIWIVLFQMCWASLSREDRDDIETGLISLVTKDFHNRQADKRPNCVQTLLEGIARCQPKIRFPSHVMKFQAKNFDAWYTAATFIEEAAIHPIVDTPAVRESNLDALVELYASLQEDDLFYGTWRRRCQFVETNAALSYEQNGVWDKAQHMYEQAQIKARTGSLAYSQGEYMLWEDHWVYCAEKLQQWEILGDFAKHENLNDLFLEATWRNYDAWSGNENREQLDSIIKAVSDAPTPRRLFFSAFMSLLRFHNKNETQQDFNRACDDNIQLSIRQWHKLPNNITKAHISLLQNFQSIVELHDASVICGSLAQTNASNLDAKSQELKLLLSTWRERLPNFWDDINAWQDLVTWRQHIFHLINGTYLQLIPTGQSNASSQSYAYRGYHETAWIINRFAHVARKHQMPDVCISQLSRIYTLPNIEIQEAFLKLREQAKCHYQNKSELSNGLEVINNTNLNYFGPQQKAEFYTLKGMFLAKLNHKDEANDAFGTALFFDIKLPKAWAEWGRYNDDLFRQDPQSMDKAANAISCYLEAAGQYKSAKSRKLLSRILWLLSLDDSEGKLAEAWNQFKGETPVWYWITFIPQLLNNLSRTTREANIAHTVLSKLAKTYPQALYFQLRTSREDMQTIKRSQELKEMREKKARAGRESSEAKQGSPSSRPGSAANNDSSRPATASAEQPNGTTNGETQPKEENKEDSQDQKPDSEAKPKKPWDHTEELMQTLKTAFPLLALSMETMVDQIQKYFKCQPDEDAYRLIVALLNDALSYVGRYSNAYQPTAKLPPSTEANITRFSDSVLPAHIRSAFEEDFVKNKPTMHDYISKLRKWRDRFEERLDRRTSKMHLKMAPHLAEFRYHKFDEVEVPGQYLLHKDKNQDFVRIERFMPEIDLVRGVTACHRRLRIRGHDGSIHPFAIQHPTPRSSRREERILQLFRIFNSILAKKKESRRRNLQFHLAIIVPLSPSFRMVQDDASYISLQGIYEDYCRRNGINKDEPILFQIEKMRGAGQAKPEHLQAVRVETLAAIQEKFVPHDVVLNYFKAVYPTYDALWLFRRQFSHQLASLTFLTFTMFITTRYPSKMNISRGTGQIWGSELVPAMAAQQPRFHNPEAVPFRLTPNLQTLMGPIHTEGIFVCALMAIARCLTETTSTSSTMPTPNPNSAAAGNDTQGSDLECHLSIFVRDEMSFWYTQQHRQTSREGELRENVQRNTDAIVNKAVAIAGEPRAGNLPASQSVLDLVARAAEPRNLGAAEGLWMGWL